MVYGYKKELGLEFDEAVVKVKDELAKEGFGVITKIDFRKKIKEKLGVDYSNYVILGACSPVHAYAALNEDKEIGLMLPCNLIVYEDGNKVVVSCILPTVIMKGGKLGEIAEEVEGMLKRVVDGL